jgi:hypothetical protein
MALKTRLFQDVNDFARFTSQAHSAQQEPFVKVGLYAGTQHFAGIVLFARFVDVSRHQFVALFGRFTDIGPVFVCGLWCSRIECLMYHLCCNHHFFLLYARTAHPSWHLSITGIACAIQKGAEGRTHYRDSAASCGDWRNFQRARASI